MNVLLEYFIKLVKVLGSNPTFILMLENLLLYALTFIIVSSAFFVILTQNTVYSVMFLVLCFLAASTLLFLLEFAFVGLLFIIIYVGAILILFLFVVMMVDIKTNYLVFANSKYFPFGVFVVSVFLIEIFMILFKNFKLNFYNAKLLLNKHYNWFEILDSVTEIQVLGNIIYTKFVFQFLISGFLLLLVLIGVIVLTLNLKKLKTGTDNDLIYKQLARTLNNTFYYK